MKLNKYLNEAFNLLFEAKININDPNIQKISRGRWKFTYDGNEYKFGAEKSQLLSGDKGYLIEWGLLLPDGSVTTTLVGGTKNVIGIFSKVMTCMAIFLEEEDPDNFSMFADVKLARVYDTLYGKFTQQYPFNQYFFKQKRKFIQIDKKELFYYHYSKKEEYELSESQFTEIINSLGGVIIENELWW